MTRKLRLLDLCCGAGGASMGYHRAGFEVVGVDVARQPNYPFVFERGDAMSFPLDGFDAIHASPPCQTFSPMTALDRSRMLRLFDPRTDLLAPMLERLAEVTVPWVVENVPTAPMPAGSVTLCGSSFALDLRRHRKFASNVALHAPPCHHEDQAPGRFVSLDWRRAEQGASVVSVHGNAHYAGEREVRERAMGITWMTMAELSEAVPPAYTEHLGRQLQALLLAMPEPEPVAQGAQLW